MAYEHSFQRMTTMQPWLPLLIAANIMGRKLDKLIRWIEQGKLRSRRVDCEYTSTGEAIEVFRDDCLYLLECLQNRSPTLTITERDIAPIECAQMDGEQIYNYLKVRGLSAAEADAEATTRTLEVLKDIPAGVSSIPPVSIVDYEADPSLLHKRLCSLETAMQTLLSHFGGVTKADVLSDPDIELLLIEAATIMTENLTLTMCTSWLSRTRQLSQDHFSAINEWGRRNPEDAAGYVDKGYPAYFTIVRASFRVRSLLERWPGSDRQGTGLYALRAGVVTEHERLQRLTFGQMQFDAFMKLQHPALIPVGHSPTDNYILDWVRKKRIHGFGGQ